jgi:hypothetical protein
MEWINFPSAEKKTALPFQDTSDGNESVSPAPRKHLKGKEPAQHVGGKHVAKQSNKAKAALLKDSILMRTQNYFSAALKVFI